MTKRIIISSVLTVVFLASLVARIGYIVFSNSYTVSDTYNSYLISLDSLEPNIYYSNYARLTNNSFEKYALLKPNAKTIAEIPLLFDNTDDIVKELSEGKPILKKCNYVKTNYIKFYNVTKSVNNCSQLISKQSSGLLSYLPDSVGKRQLKFLVDARGNMLTGDEGEIIDDNYGSSEGVMLTLDEDIQNIVYNACRNMQSGCAIVMDISDSSILACVNKPDTSYINKSFTLYPAGSVFKVIIVACALENRINPQYVCNGKIKVGDTVYSCQKEHKHGKQNLEKALANSCNCYFVNLALQLSSDKIINTAEKFGYGENISLYKDWIIKGSVLPDMREFKTQGELPLIAFGQGRLMVTPLQICNSLCVIANGGHYNQIRLVDSEIDKFGKRTKLDYPKSKRIISARNSYLLLKYMRSVVEYGTGKTADYNNESAGKTATAQTGQYRSGKEILNTWFAGVYPYSSPKYAIVIMTEEGKSGAEDCCPIFRTIVENLN